MNSEFIKTREGLAYGKFAYVIADTPVALRIWNKNGTGGGSASVVVTSATGIVLTDSAGTVTTITFATAGQTTLAGVAGTINASASWGCRVLDGLRSDASASNMVSATVTAATLDNGVVVWDCVTDTSVFKQLTYTVTYDRTVGTDNTAKTALHRNEIRKVAYFATLGAATTDKVQVWSRPVAGNGAETKFLSATSVSATTTSIVDYSSTATRPFLTATEGYEFVFLVKDATSLADTAALMTVDFIRV